MPPQLLQLGGADLLWAAGAAQPPGQAVRSSSRSAMVYRRKFIVGGDIPAPRPTRTAGNADRGWAFPVRFGALAS
jgi:hypothetical protein